jgi:hypothetical protein
VTIKWRPEVFKWRVVKLPGSSFSRFNPTFPFWMFAKPSGAQGTISFLPFLFYKVQNSTEESCWAWWGWSENRGGNHTCPEILVVPWSGGNGGPPFLLCHTYDGRFSEVMAGPSLSIFASVFLGAETNCPDWHYLWAPILAGFGWMNALRAFRSACLCAFLEVFKFRCLIS